MANKFNVIMGSDGIYLREVGSADVKIVAFDYDVATNRITYDFLDITGASMFKMEQTAGDPEFTGLFLDQVQLAALGVKWQIPVLSRYAANIALPVGPTSGDRYLCKTAGNGWFSGTIYTYDGADWVAVSPDEGMTVYVGDEDCTYRYQNANWLQKPDANAGQIGSATWTPINLPTVGTDHITIGADNYAFPDVLSEINNPPASPTEADKHLVGDTPTGAFIGHENEVATCSADDTPGPVAWTFAAPAAGTINVFAGAATANALTNLAAKINSMGTETVVASATATVLTIKCVLYVGSTTPAPDFTLPATTTHEVADLWKRHGEGHAPGGDQANGVVPLTTANLATAMDIFLPFTPVNFSFQIQSSGAVKPTTCTMVVGTGKLTYDPTAGITHPVNGDVLVYLAWK